MVEELNVLIAGIGGQGSILMSELLGEAAIREGLAVKGGETLGIAQRGASVNSMLRIGSVPQGPLIPEGKGDLMLCLEMSEALRHLHYMSKSSFIIISTQKITPVAVSLGESVYPSMEKILGELEKNSAMIVTMDPVKLALEAGNILSANVVMLGAAFATKLLPIKVETVKAVIEARFTGKVRQINFKAFELGYQSCHQALG